MPQKSRLAWSSWRATLEVLRSRFWQLAGYELVFKLVSIALFAPLSAFFLTKLLAGSGNNAVSNYELTAFFLSPWGIILIAGGATLAFAILWLEQAGLTIIALSQLQGKHVSIIGLARFTMWRFAALCRLGLRQFGIYALTALPFLAVIGVAYKIFLTGGDINYYVQVKPPAFWWAAGIAVVAGAVYIVIALRFFLLWLFSPLILLVEGKGSKESLKRSRALVRSCFSQVRSALLRWLLSMVVLSAAVGAVLFAQKWLLMEIAGNRAALALTLTALALVVEFIAAVALSFVVATTFCILVARLYRDAVESVDLPQTLVKAGGGGEPARAIPFRLATGTAVVLLVLLAGFISYRIIGHIDLDNTVQVTAHRGSSVAAPENTISALQRAIADKADFVEIDVQETADGVIVMLHDKDLKRVAGIDRYIWEINYAELREMDIGSWFSKEFAGERIATLDEVIDLVKGKTKLNIELKFNGHDKKLAEEVCRIVDEAGFGDQCVITSLENAGLRAVRTQNRELKTGLIVTASIGDVTKLDVDFLSVNANAVSRDLIYRAHQAGKDIHVWTVNAPAQMNTMIHLGVDNIITDVPDVLVELLRERADLSQTQKVMLWLGDFLEGRL